MTALLDRYKIFLGSCQNFVHTRFCSVSKTEKSKQQFPKYFQMTIESDNPVPLSVQDRRNIAELHGLSFNNTVGKKNLKEKELG